MSRSLWRCLGALLLAATLTVVTSGTAAAYEPVDIVHTERVQVGPYGVTVGFSEWPLRALQSLDFTFVPDGGIAGKSGTLQTIGPGETIPLVEAPGGQVGEPLVRHPRKRDVWGLDVQALENPGDWRFRFVIEGPAGRGVGELRGLHVLEQPGPPLALSWSVSTLPLLALVGFVVVAWRRVRPVRDASPC